MQHLGGSERFPAKLLLRDPVWPPGPRHELGRTHNFPFLLTCSRVPGPRASVLPALFSIFASLAPWALFASLI